MTSACCIWGSSHLLAPRQCAGSWLSKLRQSSCVAQTRVVPKYADNAQRPASNVWKDATMNSSNAISGVDYVKLNATLARYFENFTLVEKVKTQAIVVIYKVRPAETVKDDWIDMADPHRQERLR